MAITSNHIQNNQNRSGNMSTNAAKRAYRPTGTSITVREGETLKGVVSDIHGNEITISMEDGSSFTGRLPEASQYSIGQKAAFLITSLDSGTIYMKAMSHAYLLGMDDTIEQALEEAGLPKSPRNLEIVKSLLENQQSISRDNINNSLQLCAKYPDADVNTIISMKRLGIPMDQATVTQFDNYQNQTHQLLTRMDTLSENINNLLSELSSESPQVAQHVANQALEILLNSPLSLEEFDLATQQAIARQESENTDIPIEDTEGVPPEINTPEENASEQIAETVVDENTEEANSPFAKMKQLINSITDRAVNGTETETPNSKTFIPEQTGHILTSSERDDLTNLLTKYTSDDKFISSLKEGDLTAREVLTYIKNNMTSFSEDTIKELFSSKEFQKLMKGQLLSGWTLSPEQLKEKGSVNSLYQKIQNQLSDLTNLSQMFASRPSGEAIIHTTSDMQQNMQFMKMLNEQFSYMQLPLKLSQENAHGDLYVMTNKNKLKKSPDNLRVLLHLEMDSLGTLDIHITKENTNITTRFFVAKDNARKLLEKNAELLRDAINEKGYSFTSEFLQKEKDIDLVHDFIEQEAPVGAMTRYNFDLRA